MIQETVAEQDLPFLVTYYNERGGIYLMAYDSRLVAAKLRRWEKYINNYRLPSWEQIPDLGLYMEQVIMLLKQYLDYLPPELKEEEFITAATINNYVRTKVMPGPVKKKYYRVHIAYLIVICTMKQGMSLALIHRLMPMDIDEDQVRAIYEAFVTKQQAAAAYFVAQVRNGAGAILEHEEPSVLGIETTEELITACVFVGSLSRLLAEKLMLLENRTLEEGFGENADVSP